MSRIHERRGVELQEYEILLHDEDVTAWTQQQLDQFRMGIWLVTVAIRGGSISELHDTTRLSDVKDAMNTEQRMIADAKAMVFGAEEKHTLSEEQVKALGDVPYRRKERIERVVAGRTQFFPALPALESGDEEILDGEVVDDET